MYQINTKAIKLKYGSLAAFMREEKIEDGVFYGLCKKTSISFQVGSKQHKAFNRIKALGFVNEIEEKEIA